MPGLEPEIAGWRSFMQQHPAVDGSDIDELEDHLRSRITELKSAGLSDDEAFLVAVKRMGNLDELTGEFAREHTGRLWRQLIATDSDRQQGGGGKWQVVIVFAFLAAVSAQVARLAAGFPNEEPTWLARNAALLVLPFLAGYFTRIRRLGGRQVTTTAISFLVVAVVINVYPYAQGSSTELLVAAHLPVLLWLMMAYPYMGGNLQSSERRMDFVRFTGEWFIYFVLMALGGGVLLALTVVVLEPTGVDVERVFEWIWPSGAAGAMIVAAWLVEVKQSVVENMAPVLTMIFTPLFAAMLVASTVAYIFSGQVGGFDRELLFVFDALLVVVYGLVLFGTSARDASASAGWPDRIQLVAVIAALVLDAIVLGAMIARIGDFGFTPNRTVALGLNLLLLVNLCGFAWLSIRFLTRRSTFHKLESWQTSYLPVIAIWAAVVVIAFPAIFGFE